MLTTIFLIFIGVLVFLRYFGGILGNIADDVNAEHNAANIDADRKYKYLREQTEAEAIRNFERAARKYDDAAKSLKQYKANRTKESFEDLMADDNKTTNP